MSEASGASIEIRALRPDDADGIVALYAACMATEPGIGPITAEQWTAAMRQARFNYGRDFLVAMDGSELIGSAESSLRDRGPRLARLVKIMVRPSRRRRGLGQALLRAVLAQGPAAEPVLIETIVRQEWAASLGFLTRFSVAVTETEIFMRCSTLRSVPHEPEGVYVTRADISAVASRAAEIHNAAYREIAGFVAMTAEDMRSSLQGSEVWTASLSHTVVAISILIGTAVGLVAGYYGGFVGAALMRFVDAILCFPSVFLLLALAAFISPNVVTITLIIAVTGWMEVARVVQGQIRTLRTRDFTLAAELMGASGRYVMINELLRNAIGPIIVAATLTVARAILAEAYVSFLGYGIQAPVASWGNMLNNAQQYLGSAPWLAIFPGLMITLAVASFNFVGDGLRDALDARVEL